MNESQYHLYHGTAVSILAEEEAHAYGLTSTEALQRALAAFERLVPGKHLDATQQYLFTLEVDSDEVGFLWYELRFDGQDAYIYDIFVLPNHRRRGYARTALKLLEVSLISQGIERVFLNVFVFNEPAKKLYRSMGYTVKSLQMTKNIPYD